MDCSDRSLILNTGVISVATLLVAFQVLGIALYQAGALHLRSSNTILVQALVNIAIGSILWYCVGYSLVYGSSQKGFIGNPNHAFFMDVLSANCSSHARTVPSVLFAAFEMMLAISAPFMVMAAWTEHINMVGAVVLFVLWPLTVYYPLSHWIRGGGWLADLQIIDYAGSLTVHTSSGVAGLVFTKILSPCVPKSTDRSSHHAGDTLHHVTLVCGAIVTIIGWFIFSVGCTQMVPNASSSGLSIVNTHLSSCASSLCWVVVLAVGSSRCVYSDLIAGIIAGIVGASAAAASIHVWASLITGLLVGVTSSLAQCCARRFGRSWTNGSKADVTYTNGIPGAIGAIAAGLFTDPSLDARGFKGAFYANGKQLGVQLLGVAMSVIWSAVWTYLMSWLIHLTVFSIYWLLPDATAYFFNIISQRSLGVRAVELNFRSDGSWGYWVVMEAVGFNLNRPVAIDPVSNEPSSSKSHGQVIMREKLFSAATSGELRELETLATKNVKFGIQDFDNRTALLLASSHGHIQSVKFLLRQPGVDIHAKDRWRATPLSEAIQFGHDRVVQCLIRHGASWTEDGAGDILCAAVAKNDMEEVSRVVALGADVNAPNSDGCSAIHVAAKLGSRGVVQYLVDQRANTNAVDSWGNAPLNYADMHEHRAVIQLLESLGARRASRHYSMQEICEVASTGNLQMLRHMVHNGASVSYRDFNRRTPLHASCTEGHLDVVKFLLLQPGIDINARDSNNNTPVLDAIVHKHHEVVEYLKSHGGTIDECKLASIVTELARTGDIKALKRMLRWSGHVNVRDHNGQTALHVAAMHGRQNVVTMLLKEGADTSLVNRLSKTPLELACDFHHVVVEKELRRHVKLSEEILQTEDKESTSCYQRNIKSRRRRHKTEPSTYHYSKRESWSSTDNSAEAKKHIESSMSTDLSREILPMGGVQNEQKASRPPFLRVMPISQLSPTTREMTGGNPDYV